ncbi:unnamed protein product, partial [Ectocarpus sp. 12 AP-2014]
SRRRRRAGATGRSTFTPAVVVQTGDVAIAVAVVAVARAGRGALDPPLPPSPRDVIGASKGHRLDRCRRNHRPVVTTTTSVLHDAPFSGFARLRGQRRRRCDKSTTTLSRRMGRRIAGGILAPFRSTAA